MREPILVTGAAGFIGYHVCKRLIEEKRSVIALDNMNDYYSRDLKWARTARLVEQAKKASVEFQFHPFELTAAPYLQEIVRVSKPATIIHLAAQAGVRYSDKKPFAYTDANVSATHALLEAVRQAKPDAQMIVASTGSVYGSKTAIPFTEAASAEVQDSIYGATKRAAEIMCATYSNAYHLRITASRFFSVYGEWGRPDMALWKFTDAMLKERTIKIFDDGKLSRPFTHVDDVVDALMLLANSVIGGYDVYNVATDEVHTVRDMLAAVQGAVNPKTMLVESVGFQAGDIAHTAADTTKLRRLTGWKPRVTLLDGARRFVEWFKEYNAGQWSMID